MNHIDVQESVVVCDLANSELSAFLMVFILNFFLRNNSEFLVADLSLDGQSKLWEIRHSTSAPIAFLHGLQEIQGRGHRHTPMKVCAHLTSKLLTLWTMDSIMNEVL